MDSDPVKLQSEFDRLIQIRNALLLNLMVVDEQLSNLSVEFNITTSTDRAKDAYVMANEVINNVRKFS